MKTAKQHARRRPGRAKPAARRRHRHTFRPGLERGTALMPWLIAETVCGEAARYLDVEIPERCAAWLEARAEWHYARHRGFRARMCEPGNAGRDWLYAYMRHWLAALLQIERPDLFARLPKEFAIGHPLPQATPPAGPAAAPPRPWNPRLIARHRHWRWLAEMWPADGSSARARRERFLKATESAVDRFVLALHA